MGIAAVWGIAPLVLLALAIRDWRGTAFPRQGSRLVLPAVASASFLNWASFILLLTRGSIGGFGTHYMTTRIANWFMLYSFALLLIGVAVKVARGKIALANALLLALWVGSEVVA
jgi:hypothetical protein